MAPKFDSKLERAYLAHHYGVTGNAAQVGQMFAREFHKPRPTRKTIKRIYEKREVTGKVENLKAPGKPRTVRTPENREVIKS